MDFKIIISEKSNAFESSHSDESDTGGIYISFLEKHFSSKVYWPCTKRSKLPCLPLSCYWNFIFYFASAVFRCLSNYIALKVFLHHCVVFFIILRCDSDFWSVFLRGLIFGLILLLSDWKSLRLDILGLKRNWNKRNPFLNSTR